MAMKSLRGEIAAFRRGKQQEAADARQMAALQIVCGIDLGAALAAAPEERARIVSMLARKLRRERQRGLARHWAYDLNRHIALKQALDRLAARSAANEKGGLAAAFGSPSAARRSG
jgi:hypothetical protein